jgi:hypothetical protein
MMVDLSDPATYKRAQYAVQGYQRDSASNPGMGERVYGSDDKMLRQYLNDCGFAGITETEARAVLHKISTPD